MQFVEPNEKYLSSYYEACKETWGKVHNNYIIHNPDEFEFWKDTIFIDYENQKNGINLPEGYVPSVTYWVVAEGRYIGTINIRLKLNDNLKKYGGVVGVVIRTSERNKKYGTKSFIWALNKAKKLKISPLMLSCQKSNEISYKCLASIEGFGSCKIEEDIVVENGILQPIYRFWYE